MVEVHDILYDFARVATVNANDCSVAQIPLYAHLRMASTQPVKRPPTPELVKATRLKGGRGRKAHFDPSAPDERQFAPND